MIAGPSRTPYEDGLFFFDFQLSSDYPQSPPVGHYYSYCTDRLNPNLYEDGKVCVSLLGTWSGKGTESWTPNSNMLQLLVSIQGKRRDVCDVGCGTGGKEGHGRTRKVLLGRFRLEIRQPSISSRPTHNAVPFSDCVVVVVVATLDDM